MVTTRHGKSNEIPLKRSNDSDPTSSSSSSSSSNTPALKKHKGKEKTDCAVDVPMIDEEMLTEEAKDADNDDEDVEEGDDDDDDDDDDEEIDWQNIQLPISVENPIYKDIEITMDAPVQTPKASHWERAYQRTLCEWTHNSHILCLTAHYMLRNRWCSRPEIQSIFSSIIPSTIQHNGASSIEDLISWWKTYFTITGPGLQSRSVNHFRHIKDRYSLKKLIEKQQSNEEGDVVENFDKFLDLLSLQSGARDTCAELFVAALRSCGYNARLVCSLQPVSYKTPTRTKKPVSLPEQEQEVTTAVVFEFRRQLRAPTDIDMQLKDSRAKPPIVWAEVFLNDEWVCVDPIRGHIDQPLRMEPALLDRTNRLSFVLAFDPVDKKGRGNITDVTRRYTSHFERVLKERERPLNKREISEGHQLWTQTFLNLLTQSNRMKERDIEESHSLDERRLNEVMPKALGKFNNHPLYALERHLKKFEILYPKEPILGMIKGEKVYPRECVKTLRTADTYRKEGREIKKGEQPLKMVKANAVTIEKKREKERAKQEGNEMMVPCYGEWQTQLYVPSPIVNGKIVKNAYGNIDLFTPTMLPKGAAHIPIKGISKMANKLGIDYADAVVNFEFVKMRAVPVINGIVVAEESKQILLEVWEEHDQNEVMKAIEKQEKEMLLRWRKLIKSLLIKARVDRDYGKEKQDDVWASYNNNNEEEEEGRGGGGGGGGFLPED